MIKIAICDDEIAAIQSLESLISSFFHPRTLKYSIAKFLDGAALLNKLVDGKEHFDIVFLDIQMSTISGIDVAKIIRKTNQEKVFIIFVTVLKEYVFEAFDVSAANYLVKPIAVQKLHTTLEKIMAEILPAENKYLLLHKGNTVNKIPLCNIMYCDVVDHRVIIYEAKNTHEYSSTIDDLAKELNEDFFRCHRSFIINLKYVDSYRSGIAYLPNTEKIPIATRRQKAFLKALLNYQCKEVR